MTDRLREGGKSGLLTLCIRKLIPCRCSALTSPIITIVVGGDQRLFAAHEDVLSISPFFRAILKEKFLEDGAKQVTLPDE